VNCLHVWIRLPEDVSTGSSVYPTRWACILSRHISPEYAFARSARNPSWNKTWQ